MNEIIKVLTIITTFFIPITFITGFFGINFFEPVANLVGWTSQQVFIGMMAILLGMPLAMYIWMRGRTCFKHIFHPKIP